MRIRIPAVIFLAAVLPGAGAAQELVPLSGKTRYNAVQIAPSKNEIIAIARVPCGEPTPGVGSSFVTSLHFFDRKGKAKFELAPATLPAGDGGISSLLEFIAFWPDGSQFVAGGRQFFAGWKNPSRECVFFHKGDADGFLEQLEIRQFVAPRKDARIAYVSTRRLDPLSGPYTEFKLTLWDRGVSKEDIVSLRVDKRLFAPRLDASISGDGKFLACFDVEANKITVHDASQDPIKEHAAFDLKLPYRTVMCFAHDNNVFWMLSQRKLYSFDLTKKTARKPIEFKRDPFWMHALADGSYILFAESENNKKGNDTVLNLFDPKTQKIQGRVSLGKAVGPLAISADDGLLAGAGVGGGIFLWDLPSLLAKRKKE